MLQYGCIFPLNKINKIKLIVVFNETEILFLFSVICSSCFEYYECDLKIYTVQLCNTGDSKSLCVCVCENFPILRFESIERTPIIYNDFCNQMETINSNFSKIVLCLRSL